jgi:hypothetical protein
MVVRLGHDVAQIVEIRSAYCILAEITSAKWAVGIPR